MRSRFTIIDSVFSLLSFCSIEKLFVIVKNLLDLTKNLSTCLQEIKSLITDKMLKSIARTCARYHSHTSTEKHRHLLYSGVNDCLSFELSYQS